MGEDQHGLGPNKIQVTVCGFVAVASALRLLSSDMDRGLWLAVNLALLVVGLVGFVLAWLRPSAFEK